MPTKPFWFIFLCICVQVLFLSFSLLISSNLNPEPYSQRGRPEHKQTKGVHTHRCTHTHTLFFPLPFLWPYSCLPLPATSGWGARYLSSRLQLHSICGQLGTKTLTDLNTMDFSSAHSRISVTVQTLQMWSSRCFVSSTPGACKHKQSANWYVFLSSFCTTRRLHI